MQAAVIPCSLSLLAPCSRSPWVLNPAARKRFWKQCAANTLWLVTAGRTVTFATRITNPKRKLIGDTQVNFGIFEPYYNSPNVTARQIHISVSRHGHRGPFVPLRLTGSTSKTAGIIGVIGGPTGFNLRAHHTLTLTYRLRVSKSVPLGRRRPILEFQTFLDQIDPASGADSVLATTPATNARVR